jgi:hypothetical protein
VSQHEIFQPLQIKQVDDMNGEDERILNYVALFSPRNQGKSLKTPDRIAAYLVRFEQMNRLT